MNNIDTENPKFISRRNADSCPCPKDTNNKDGKFRPLDIKNENGDYTYGFCYSCNKWFLPKTEKADDKNTQLPPKPPRPKDYVSTDLVGATLAGYSKNTFVQWLASLPNPIGGNAVELAKLYLIGTTSLGECIFWEVDQRGRAMYGLLKKHDTLTGKSLHYFDKDGKESGKARSAITRLQYKGVLPENFNNGRCFFGLHLIHSEYGRGKTVAIVEGQKTAVVMSQIVPQLLWISCNGSGGFQVRNLEALKGRKVLVFPDTGKDGQGVSFFDTWSEVAERANFVGHDIEVSTLLKEAEAKGEIGSNADLLDYYLPKLLNKATVSPNTSNPKAVQLPNKPNPPKKGISSNEKPISSEVQDNETDLKEVETLRHFEENGKAEQINNLIEKLDLEIIGETYYEAFSGDLSDDKAKGVSIEQKSREKAVTGFYSAYSGVYPERVVLGSWLVVTDVAKFINTNLGHLEGQGASRDTALDRLEEMRQALEHHAIAQSL